MKDLTQINPNLFRLTVPYKDIFTTVYVIRTEQGVLLFDAASYDEDTPNYILPMLAELGIAPQEVKYIFISHNHTDHAGGLAGLLPHCSNACIVSRSPTLKEKYPQRQVLCPQAGDHLLEVLEVVPIPGHTQDCAALLDHRTHTMITGDCLQLFGIFGSGNWCANITLPAEHLQAIEALRHMDNVEEILTAHDYHPYGYHYVGKKAISDALDACVAPLDMVRELILTHPEWEDEQVREQFNAPGTLPKLGVRMVTALRQMLNA